MSGADHNSNSLDYSVSDSKDSLDFRINHSCPMEIDAHVTINHESNRFGCAANETPLIDTSHENEFFLSSTR